MVAQEYQLVYITLKYLLRDLKIIEMFRSEIFVDLVALVVDEASSIDIEIDAPNVSYIIHWGPPKTVEGYVQESGWT